MQGPEAAGGRVATWLRDRMPTKLRQIEARLSADDAPVVIVDPAQVLDHETGPIPIESWPAIYCMPQRTRRTQLVDVDTDGTETYRVTYTVQVLMWVRADSYEETDALRKRYVLAVRECLLDRKTLALPGVVMPPAAVVPDSLVENYGPVDVDEGRTIAGAELLVDVILLEVLAGPEPRGVANDFEVTATSDTAAVPPHPAL